MEEKTLKAWGSGPIKIGDAEIDCYILEDGTPILNKGKMMKAIGRQWKGTSRTDRPNFIGAMNLQEFIRPELEEQLKGIEFYNGGRIISGYHADTLVSVCNVYLEAKDFLEKNGFERDSYGIFRNELCAVKISESYYCVGTYDDNFREDGFMFSPGLNIYWLIGVLTYYGLIDKNYIQ